MYFTELWTALTNMWQAISVERFQKLVESVPRRVEAVIKTRGGPTRYKLGIHNSMTLQYIYGLTWHLWELRAI
ncbi:hypothetical protein TNCV_593321 [Trichonephila clavipes]|nr:hypothetical protein TNCV_593321 [Trichonephila clavipes]